MPYPYTAGGVETSHTTITLKSVKKRNNLLKKFLNRMSYYS